MRAYKITAQDSDGVLGTRYAGTNAQAREVRDQLVGQFGVKKKDVTIEDAEIPTAKADLLEFINELVAEQDYVEEDDSGDDK